MSDRELTRTYEPNPVLRAVYRPFFDRIHVDEAWVTAVRDLAARGSVIYVLRNLNFIDFLALDYLTKRYGLPQVRFVNDLGLWILNPLGKGWLNGSQSQLEYLPERHTDFIFAVIGEEFGLLGLALLLLLYLFVVGRALYLAAQTQDTFARLLASSLALTFFVYIFINTGMVSGLLPVVGVPLPLVSYGGTSMVTLLAGFGILMALYSHRKLIGS